MGWGLDLLIWSWEILRSLASFSGLNHAESPFCTNVLEVWRKIKFKVLRKLQHHECGLLLTKSLLAFYIPTYLYVSTNVCIYANFALAGVSSGEVKKGQFLSM